MNKEKILCVDDDVSLLKGLALNLGRKYEVHTAASGELGLGLFAKAGPFAAVVSDMRMPGLDGAHFLACARTKWPETTRLLLTGQTELEAALRAVNNGQVFRFLTKPCSPADLTAAIEAAVEQHRLLRAEKELLERTLKGSIEAMAGILAMVNPAAFGRGERIRAHAAALAGSLGIGESWALESAALLSQIGMATLPPDTAGRLQEGLPTDAMDRAALGEAQSQTRRILGGIPRLDPVLALLDAWQKPASELPGKVWQGPRPAAILRVVSDFDELESRGTDPQTAFDTLRGREGEYPQDILEGFARLHGRAAQSANIQELPIEEIRPGMVFTQDVRSRSGTLLVARGFRANDGLLARLRNLPKNAVPGSVPVRIPPPEAPAGG